MRHYWTSTALAMALAGAFVFLLGAADIPALYDGSDHGDPPFLTEIGWKPLLNGKNLDGWQGASEAARRDAASGEHLLCCRSLTMCIDKDGYVLAPTAPGLGYPIDHDALDRMTVRIDR